MPHPLMPLVAAALLCAASLARAQESALQEQPVESTRETPIGEQPEYGGVVTTQVVTSMGYLFAARFTEFWNQQPLAESAVLSVRERTSARYGTEVSVIHNDAVLFRGVLPRQSASTMNMAESAAQSVNERLGELQLQQLLFEDRDLARSAF